MAKKWAERKAVKEAKEMEKAAKKASKENAKSATDTVATRCSVMVENEDNRRGSKRQAQDIVSSRRTKKNKIDFLQFFQTFVVSVLEIMMTTLVTFSCLISSPNFSLVLIQNSIP